eukprot:6465310-Amphidinium_carterae.2
MASTAITDMDYLVLGSFRPNRPEHAPGMLNSLADAASRQFDPVPASIPDALLSSEQVVALVRTVAFYCYASVVSPNCASEFLFAL